MFHKIVTIIAAVTLLGINRQDLHQPLTDTELTLEGHSSIEQTFTTSYDNLNIVSICLRNPSRLLTPMEFSLHEATVSAQPIREISFSGGNILNQDCTRFQFAPIDDSKGKTFVAQIKTLNDEKKDTHMGMYIEAYGAANYIQGDAYVDGVKTPDDLHIKTFYRSNLGITLRESIDQFFIRLTQDLPFFILYITFIVFIVYRIIKIKK